MKILRFFIFPLNYRNFVGKHDLNQNFLPPQPFKMDAKGEKRFYEMKCQFYCYKNGASYCYVIIFRILLVVATAIKSYSQHHSHWKCFLQSFWYKKKSFFFADFVISPAAIHAQTNHCFRNLSPKYIVIGCHSKAICHR